VTEADVRVGGAELELVGALGLLGQVEGQLVGLEVQAGDTVGHPVVEVMVGELALEEVRHLELLSDILLVDVTVGFMKNGDGPRLIGDPRLGREIQQSFVIAGVVACQAIGYDPRFIVIRLVFPAARMFEQGFHIDGPSVGVSAAVAVASAMLGDSVRPKLCMTGVIRGPTIGPVGGIEKKEEADWLVKPEQSTNMA